MQTSSFQITLVDSSRNIIEKLTDQLPYFIDPGAINNFNFEFSNRYMEQSSNCLIYFTKQNPLNSLGLIHSFIFFLKLLYLGLIQIDFPPGFDLNLINSIVPINGIASYFQFKIVNQSLILFDCFNENDKTNKISFEIISVVLF